MNLVKSAFASAAVLAGSMFASAPDTADAQIRFSIGSSNFNRYDGYRGGSYGYSNRGYRSNSYGDRGFVGRGDRVWHDTSHYDYHPTTITPHGNHYHVTPGHYDYHQTGHYDTYRGGTYRGGHSGHNH